MAAFSTTNDEIYFVNLNAPTERVKVQFVPKDLQFDRSIDNNEVKIIGRNNPLHHYSSGATKLNFELDFYAEQDNLEDVQRRCEMVKSWTYNDGYQTSNGGVPQIKLIFGKLFKDGDTWTITACSWRFEHFDKRNGWLPKQAYMQLTLSLDTAKDLKSRDLKKIW